MTAAIKTQLQYPSNPVNWQCDVLALRNREIFINGYNGKSELLLMAAFRYMEKSDRNAIIFCKSRRDIEYPEHSDSIFWRASNYWRNHVAISGVNRWMRFPSGSYLYFGCPSDDPYRYRSMVFSFIGFQHLEDYSEQQYQSMLSRLRMQPKSESSDNDTLQVISEYHVHRQWIVERLANATKHDIEYTSHAASNIKFNHDYSIKTIG